MTPFDRVYTAAQRHHDNMEPIDEPDYLADKPRGFCPWDGAALEVADNNDEDDLFGSTDWHFCQCDHWDFWSNEDANRARYAEERAKEAELARRLNKEGVEW